MIFPALILLLGAVTTSSAPTKTPQPIVALDPTNCTKAAAYSRQHGGEVLYIVQSGRPVFADYATGFSDSTPHKIYSGTKNFVALTALVAMQEGLLTLDEPASKTLTEWQGDKRRTITLAQLLSQTSGLDSDGDSIYASPDQLTAAVRIHLIDPPGTRFHYGAVGYQAFGEILKRKLQPLGKTVEGYMKDKVFDPLDIDIADWKHDDAGNPLMHAGLSLSAREWVKLGNYMCGVGRHEPVVNRSLLPLLLTGHKANPAYGISFWLNRPQAVPRKQRISDLLPAADGDQLYPGGPHDLVAAMGTGKQRLYIIPSRQLVIVRFAYSSPFSDGDFLSRLLTGKPHPDAHTH